MENSVEEKVASILDDIRNKIEIYLQWCESPIERLLLLAFIENSITSLSFTVSSEDTAHLPTLSDEYGLELAPAGLHWIEINELIIQKDRKFLRRLIPQYPINDEFENVSYRIDFALFWPRTDGDMVISGN